MTQLEQLTLTTEQTHRDWVRAFTWHLDVVPPLIEVIIWMTYPHVRASRFDQIKITGGGYIDNVPDVESAAAVLADARELWWLIVDYTRAVAEWIESTRPAPALDEQPNADPLSARSDALLAVGWLIDHAEHIHQVHELDEHTDSMLADIRRLRGRYGVFPKPRPQRERCRVCGERKVASSWMQNPTGSPKPLRVTSCQGCGDTHTIEDAVTPARSTTTVVLSEACADLAHEACRSLHCQCTCHVGEP